MTAALPHDVDPAIWTVEGVNRFARADGAVIYGIGRGQWCAYLQSGPAVLHLKTQRATVRKFPSAGAAARFLGLNHPQEGPSA